jgi:uncharacterized UPF0146 family protein
MNIVRHSAELGKYCIDISKAIAVTVVITPLVKDGFAFRYAQFIMLGAGLVAASGFLILGLLLINLRNQ